jgi:hypothetical protein
MKHIGKMKNNNAKVIVVYRTLPGDPYSALVIGSDELGPSYHDALMNLVQDPSGQSANEFADILSVRKFPDGNGMLVWLHTNGFLKKVPTDLVIMTPAPQTSLRLDELNLLIADQRGIDLEDLAIKSGDNSTPIKTIKSVKEEPKAPVPVTAADLRAKADLLLKEAQELKKQADVLDPPKKKTKTVKTETA